MNSVQAGGKIRVSAPSSSTERSCYEIGYSAELADDTSAVFTPEELVDNGIALVIYEPFEDQ